MFSRNSKFEVYVQKENRWALQSAFDEEVQAVQSARNHLGVPGVQAVRVVEEWSGLGGRRKEREVLSQQAVAGAKKATICLEPDPFSCKLETLEDIYHPVVRRAIGQIMKNFLTELVISPTEFVHGGQHMKRFFREERLPGAFYFIFVKFWQDAPKDVDAGVLTSRMDKLFNEAMNRAAGFSTGRKLVIKSREEAVAALTRSAELSQEDGGRFAFNAALSEYLGEFRAWPAKLDEVFNIAIMAKDDRMWQLTDEICAEVLEMSEMIRDLLGDHKNLATALMVLADYVMGESAVPGAGGWSNHLWISKGISRGRLPRTQASLLLRLVRALNGNNPLTKTGARADGQALGDLRKKLTLPTRDLIGGKHMESAFERRWSRVRETLLQE